ncbi:MAG: putative nuclease of putative toxin-antitoxin system [Granulosicoccus sp.]|jgi:predicted nuclease of predicted toxin-antitoxin system
MKLLLDEQMPRKIARHFPASFTVEHVQLVGWGGIKNGALLKLASDNGYDALISADKNMSYQQNEDALKISVVVLNVHQLRLNDLVALLPSALRELQQATRPRFIRVDV